MNPDPNPNPNPNRNNINPSNLLDTIILLYTTFGSGGFAVALKRESMGQGLYRGHVNFTLKLI